MLPTCCLRSPVRSGQRKLVAIAKWHEKLLKRWLDGDIRGLWAECKEKTNRHRHKTPKQDILKRNLERAILMAKEGNLGKAVKCLQSLGMAENNERTLDQLIEKHPTGKAVTDKQLLPMNTALKATSESVLREIASFAAGSYPGRSSLRFEHLQEAFNCSVPLVAQNCLDSFSSVVNIFLSGTAASAASKHICGANLIALKKNGDAIRPIAVGEIIRRIVSKVACSSVLSDASKLLVPHQVGVGVPAACESVIHSVRDFIKANDHRSDMAMLKIDFTNAFNLVDRQTFINEVKVKFPSIYNWVVYCYGDESLLDYNGFTIQSSCGVQQGDPIGPLLFALALNTLVAKINASCSLSIHIWYFDDGTLVGCKADLLKALNILSTEGKQYGFEVNFEKCELFWPSDTDLSEFPCEIKRIPTAGVELLGSHIGCPESQEQFLQKKTLEIIAVLELLPELNESQIEFAILKNCLGVCKINHLLRSLPPIPSLSIQIFDQHQRVCLERIVSRPLNDLQWQLALLPTIKGGLGLRCASNTQLPAYLASRIATWHNVAAITGPLLNIRQSQDLKNATDKFLEQVPEFDLEEHWGVERGLQKRFSNYIINQQVGSFFDQSDSLTRANTLSFTLPHATDYLFAKPSRNLGLKFTNSEFRITLCRQLRVQIFDKTLTCIACNTSLMDSFGDHALSCSSSRDRIARHNDTRDLVFHACRSAGLSPVLEAKGLSATSRRRPGDVFIPNWKHGSPAAVDVTLTCPLQSTVINKAAEEVGYACKLAEERKFAASAELCQQSGLDFIPLALETSGGFGSCATSFLTVLAERCADNNMRDRVIEKRQLFQRINVAVHRSNANMILSRIPIREPEPLNLRFSWEKPLPTTSKRLRDEVSEEGPPAKTPLCFVEELQDNNAASFNFPVVGHHHSSVSPQPSLD